MYSSTRHRKNKQKKQEEVWFLSGKTSPQSTCNIRLSDPITTALCKLHSSSLLHSSVRNPFTSCSSCLRHMTGIAIMSSFLTVHLHKAKEESGLQKPRSNPEIHQVLNLWEQFPVSLCLCSAHWAVILWSISRVLSSAALCSVHHAGWIEGWLGLTVLINTFAFLLSVLH